MIGESTWHISKTYIPTYSRKGQNISWGQSKGQLTHVIDLHVQWTQWYKDSRSWAIKWSGFWCFNIFFLYIFLKFLQCLQCLLDLKCYTNMLQLTLKAKKVGISKYLVFSQMVCKGKFSNETKYWKWT